MYKHCYLLIRHGKLFNAKNNVFFLNIFFHYLKFFRFFLEVREFYNDKGQGRFKNYQKLLKFVDTINRLLLLMHCRQLIDHTVVNASWKGLKMLKMSQKSLKI